MLRQLLGLGQAIVTWQSRRLPLQVLRGNPPPARILVFVAMRKQCDLVVRALRRNGATGPRAPLGGAGAASGLDGTVRLTGLDCTALEAIDI